MGLKNILGLDKKTKKDITKAEKINIPTIERKKKDDEDNASLKLDKLSELNELSFQEGEFGSLDEMSQSPSKSVNDKALSSKNPFSSLKEKMSRKKGSIIQETEAMVDVQSEVTQTLTNTLSDSFTNNSKANEIFPQAKPVKKIEDSLGKEKNHSENLSHKVLDENKKPNVNNTNNISNNTANANKVKKVVNEEALEKMLDKELKSSPTPKERTPEKNSMFTKRDKTKVDRLTGTTMSGKGLDLNSRTQSNDAVGDSLLQLKQKRLPFIGQYSSGKQYQIAALLAGISLVGIISGSFLYGNATTKQNKAIEYATEFSSDVQKINTFFSDAVLGKSQAYDNLMKVTQKAKSDLDLLKNQTGIIGANSQLASSQDAIQKALYSVGNNMNLLQMQASVLANSSDKVSEFSKIVNDLNGKLDSFINAYTQQSLNQNELANVYSLKTNIQAINGLFATILLSEKIDANLIDNLNKSRKDFKNSLVALQVGDASRGTNPVNSQSLLEIYTNMSKDWVNISSTVDSVINNSNELIKIRSLTPQNQELINVLNQNITTILAQYKNSDMTGANLAKIMILLSICLLIFAMVVTFNIYSSEKDNRSLSEKIENNKNQSSILQLLNEMMPLQDGDLTKKTTVTEEITGAIADSINATIDSLASLVKKIKDTSFIMRQKTSEVNLISSEMLLTTEKQATTLNETGTAVINIANAINEISNKTEKGASDARKSVAVSEEGAKQVQDSVKSMEEIDSNMNETVYLMQKVNDSSAQIFSITEVLSDITEETAILALNAAVQAAKAGEAGKGFKIVADSIQELADKASDAARRVGALISTVQTDIQAVEQAVKKTTQEVEKGVQLSELARQSLNKMTVVSKELSETVKTISEDAKYHANTAKQISESMVGLLKATEENKISTEKAASSIAEISHISNELGDSVQSFKVD